MAGERAKGVVKKNAAEEMRKAVVSTYEESGKSLKEFEKALAEQQKKKGMK